MDEEDNQKRYEKLGFKPQKENVYNALLPYADKLDDESTQLFDTIKTNLVKAVLAREMRPGCALWTSRLNKYMRIYGMKFSKEDHIAFIKLYYELLTMPDLEPTRLNKCASTLTYLLKKTYLISRDELELEWRPLYDLCVRLLETSKTDIGMYRCFSTLESTITNVIRAVKMYFPASATQEILDEFRPKLYPLNGNAIEETINYLEVFLPIVVKPEEAPISYDLWFNELMHFWKVCHNASSWEEHMVWLMARLSSRTIGYIDWEPHIPLMYARFLRSFQLPVAYKQKQSGRQYKIDVLAISLWITSTLNGDKNSSFFHFEKFMQTLVSLFYPANAGRWTAKLRELLRKLAYCFIERVYAERYRSPCWEDTIPENKKLTDEDIDRFVNIMKPCIEKAMFARAGAQDVTLAIQYLAALRPHLVIPIILDNLYASMDSLTEPHKLTASMMAATSVARFMVQGSKYNYPAGPTHVIPFLIALLPGIDTNDIRKCLVTFNFIVHFVNMIPVVNCSEAYNYYPDLTEEEHIVCEATDNFQDFILEFCDRICTWVEANSLEFIRLEQSTTSTNTRSRSELIAENALFTVISAVMYQCSPTIFTAALKKIFNFVRDKVMEVQVSGRMIGTVCQAFSKVNPKETLKLFVPYLCDRIENVINETHHFDKEENLDAELLYNYQILSEIFEAKAELIIYADRLMDILDKTLHIYSLQGCQMSARLLECMLASLTFMQPNEFRSTAVPFETPLKDHLPIRDWGKSYNVKDLKMTWYVPGDGEMNLIEKLFKRYLVPELDKLDKYSSGELTLTRIELRRSLRIVSAMLSAHPVLPMWDETPIQLVDSVLEPFAFNLIVSACRTVAMPDGSNVRKTIAAVIQKVQNKILILDEGDTKSINHIIHIYNVVLFNKSRAPDFDYQWKNFHLVKKLSEDRLHRNKMHLRHIHINRVLIQQEFRSESRSCSFTETHKQILLSLFDLSVSRYSEVRVMAQSKLFAVVSYFPYSYTVLTERILDVLRLNSEEHHEQFKGCLYVLIGPKNAPIVTRHDWAFVKKLWPLIVTSQPSEKPSIVNLINNILDVVHRFFPTIAINLFFTDRSLEAAKVLSLNVPKCNLNQWNDVMDGSVVALEKKCKARLEAYNETVKELLAAMSNGRLHWRYLNLAATFMKVLVHYDVKYNEDVIIYFVGSLLHDSLTMRKIAIRIVLYIMIQYKPKFKKIEINPADFSKDPPTNTGVPGYRADNEWLMYNRETVPKNSDEWEQTRFVHSSGVGYFAWPKILKTYAPPSQQPHIDTRFEDMNCAEFILYEFFSNEENVEKFIKFLSLEEKKGKDQFNAYKFLLFKNLFKIFEDKVLHIFVPHLKRLVSDRNESSQRCAAEMIGGLIRGAKHWNYQKTVNLWETLLPILELAINNMCPETMADYGLAMAMSLDGRDPNKHHWLLEFLAKDPLNEQSSFVICGRIHMMHAALNQQIWRNSELSLRIYDYFKNHLADPYQNIRDKMSGCLSLIFSKDLVFAEGDDSSPPIVREFFREIAPVLDQLYTYTLTKVEKATNQDVAQSLEALSLDNGQVREKSMRLFKLVCKYVSSSTVRMNYSTLPEFFEIIPLCLVLQNNDTDDEVAPICSTVLAVIANTTTLDKYIPAALAAIRKVASCPFWSARVVMIEFMTCFVFHNMATICSREEWVLEVESLVLDRLEDVNPEVRTNASSMLSGLLHCHFIPKPKELLASFEKKAKTKLRKKDDSASNANSLCLRHAGVLGLCAFVSSHPYDVPDYLPGIFRQLGYHLNDPQPIPTSIRKTLGDFKRTHHENWEAHKLKFTEEELVVLSDLTVPPSYYA